MKKLHNVLIVLVLNTCLLSAQDVAVTVTDTLECKVESYSYFVQLRHNIPFTEFYGKVIRHEEFERFLLINGYEIDYQIIGNNTKELSQEYDGAYELIFKDNLEINEFRAKAEALFVDEILVNLHAIKIKYDEAEQLQLISKLIRKSNKDATLIAKSLGKKLGEIIKIEDAIDEQEKEVGDGNIIKIAHKKQYVQLPNKEDIAIKRKSLKVTYSLK